MSSFSSHPEPGLNAAHGSDASPGLNAAPALNVSEVRAWALQAGFDDAGLVALPHANQARDAARYEEWVRAGRAATMRYMTRTAGNGELVRSRTAVPFPWARSAVVCFANYHSAQPRSTDPAPPGVGWIARYAWTSRADAAGQTRPSDYHKVLLKRIKALETRLRQQYGEIETRAYVDTGPIVERALAAAAGLGWIAKNTCLIHPKLGSYGFLAVLLTSVPVIEKEAWVPPVPRLWGPGMPQTSTDQSRDPQPVSESHPLEIPDRCGTCRRCLDACPTGALFAPYQMDAARCISYLTIEHRGPVEPQLMDLTGRQVFGCDICQDVCPWNRKSPIAADPELAPRPELVNPALDWLASLDEPAFERLFNGSPIRRAGFFGLRRNIAVAMGNSGLQRFAAQLEAWSEAADQGLRAAARWALAKLHAATATG